MQEDKNPTPITIVHQESRLRRFLRKRPPRRRLILVTASSILLFFIGILVAARFTPEVPPPPAEPIIVRNPPPPEPTTIASPLTGVAVDPALAARPITAVMIENSIDARPQSGLEEAGVVYEAIAEGGITRFMAVYQEQQPTNIGPIRSARPYYVRWAAGHNASYLHSGGSPEALALIRSLGVKDLDHGALGTSIASRVSTRFAPHNVYSNMATIDAKNVELGYTTVDTTAFTRKEAEPSTSTSPATASTIDFNISGFLYNTSYTYDAASNSYARTMAGQPHTDQESGKQITPEVVVALVMSYSIHPNGIHSVYGSVGTGEATIFQDGKVQQATWRKTSDSAPLELINAAGELVALNPGQTWFTAIAPGRLSFTP